MTLLRKLGKYDILEEVGHEQVKTSPVNLKIIYDQHDHRIIEFSIE